MVQHAREVPRHRGRGAVPGDVFGTGCAACGEGRPLEQGAGERAPSVRCAGGGAAPPVCVIAGVSGARPASRRACRASLERLPQRVVAQHAALPPRRGIGTIVLSIPCQLARWLGVVARRIGMGQRPPRLRTAGAGFRTGLDRDSR